jgi:hypothetical protein
MKDVTKQQVQRLVFFSEAAAAGKGITHKQ